MDMKGMEIMCYKHRSAFEIYAGVLFDNHSISLEAVIASYLSKLVTLHQA